MAAASAVWRVDARADRFFDDDPATRTALAQDVADAVARGPWPGISTGSARFDAEWAVITCQMAMAGLSRVEGDWTAAARTCGAFARSEAARAFGSEAWGADGLDDGVGGHAYLGWLAWTLLVADELAPDPETGRVADRMVDQLAASMVRLGARGLETYPGETYPTDQAAVVAAVALSHRYDPVVATFLDEWRTVAIDPGTGLQRQTVGGVPRGSGTLISAWFLASVDRPLATSLARAARAHLAGTTLGLGGIRESLDGGLMDIDSGPVVPGLGYGVSATGFGLSGARLVDDRRWHRSIFRTATVFGAPVPGPWFQTGGPIGNAILLASLTR